MAALAHMSICGGISILILIILSVVSYQFFSVATPDFAVHRLVHSILQDKSTKNHFIAEILAHEVSDPFNMSAISDLCLNRRTRDDALITCEPGTGGVGNIRSYMLHCTRFAMEIGASMVVPTLRLRTKDYLSNLNGRLIHFQHYFDRQHYIDTMQTACPHIKVLDDPGWEWAEHATVIPEFGVSITSSSLGKPSPWRVQFDRWFKDSKKPEVLRSADAGRDLSVMDDGMDFYYSIGRVLKFRPDARRLAALCIAEINDRFNVGIDPRENLFPNAYLGAHLRTSSDAVDEGLDPNFDEQTDWYINQTIKHNLKIIVATGGNDDDLKRFAEKTSTYSIKLVTKYDLLSGNDLLELNNFLWDQRGLVDFEVLLKATQYGGYARSSFSHNIAFRRHFLSKVEDPFPDPNNHFLDELSVVYGRFEQEWDDEAVRTMWP